MHGNNHNSSFSDDQAALGGWASLAAYSTGYRYPRLFSTIFFRNYR